ARQAAGLTVRTLADDGRAAHRGRRLVEQQLRTQGRERPCDVGHAERDLAERDRIARTNAGLRYARAVDEGAIARAQVAHADREARARQLGVAARDGRVDHREIAHRRASDDEGRTVL